MKINELILYSNISGDAVASDAAALFAGPMPDAETAALLWISLQRAMLAEIGRETVRATYWQNHICALIGASDNPFSRAAERGAYTNLEELSGSQEIISAAGSLSESEAGLFRLASVELAGIKEMYLWNFAAALRIPKAYGADADARAGRAGNVASLMASPGEGSRRQRVHEALTQKDDIVSAARLAAYYHAYGAGTLEANDSYYWNEGFVAVEAKDPIRLSDLIGIERQTEALIENTEFLLRGLPASNTLLYGDAGTGKSSSIKALINEYADRGLKLVAIPKARIAELPGVLGAAAERGLKFILFIDDLSFEENESTYKSFKSVIEGGVSARPDNVVICVTSNRRNIVKEVWADREHQDDIHLRDNLQEKRSLSDRFGLTIVYGAPDKDEYLAIVTGLAKKAGLDMDGDELKAAALTWEVRHGGRSGRAARQFIDYMAGKQALGNNVRK
ncbi:MAG: ATP-binding protein [Clostridiales Family XIII bacterium]|jgi:predicted AAA+ superfamily ATPase|nr:ATP-binding protein [Clostridiales Family XIII bacterium]